MYGWPRFILKLAFKIIVLIMIVGPISQIMVPYALRSVFVPTVDAIGVIVILIIELWPIFKPQIK